MDITMSRIHLASDTCHTYFIHTKLNHLLYTCPLVPLEDGILLDPLSCAYIGVSGATHSSRRRPRRREHLRHPRRKPGSREGSAKKKAAAPRRPRAHGPPRPCVHGLLRELRWSTPCARACTVPMGPPCARAQLTPCAQASQDGRLRSPLRPPLHLLRPQSYISRT